MPVSSDHLTDIVLVNPSNKKEMYGQLAENFAGIEPPLWIGLLASYLREKGHTVKIIDADAQGWGTKETVEEIERCRPMFIGIGAIGANPSASSTPKMLGVRYTIDLVKEKKLPCKIFIYGIHPSALPERTLREERADFVVRGEAFHPVDELLTALKENKKTDAIQGLWYLQDGKVADRGWAKVIRDLDALPFPAWDLLPMEKYRAYNWHCFGDVKNRSNYAVVYSSLGCPFHCYYCNIHSFYEGKPGIRFRSPQRVIEEIDWLYQNYHIRHIKILDELFVINKDRLMAICDLLIERNYGINFLAYARIDTVSEDILKKLKKAGINWLAFGIEAASDKVLQGVSKGHFDKAAVRKAIRMTQDAGIYVMGNYIFGLPDDTMDTMQETFDLAVELNCEYVNFYTAMAYPGSPLYEDAVSQGFDLPQEWIGFSQLGSETLPLPTKHLPSADVLRFRDRAFNTYYTNPNYLSMIKEKFGQETVDHINEMLKYKMHRRILLKNRE